MAWKNKKNIQYLPYKQFEGYRSIHYIYIYINNCIKKCQENKNFQWLTKPLKSNMLLPITLSKSWLLVGLEIKDKWKKWRGTNDGHSLLVFKSKIINHFNYNEEKTLIFN